MKCKSILFAFVLLFNFSSIYSQPLMYDDYMLGTYDETPTLEACDQCSGYRYVSIGMGPIVFIPNVGVGYRARDFQFGWDTALSFSTIGYAHQLTAHFVGHYHLSPMEKDSAYLGLGLMGSGVLTNRGDGGATLAPDFVLGKELTEKNNGRHFIEMHVSIPTMWMDSCRTHSLYFPLIYIKYGISF
jgi:hypothetical protein